VRFRKSGALLRQREGWGQPVGPFPAGFVGRLHSPFCGKEGVFVFALVIFILARPPLFRDENEDENESDSFPRWSLNPNLFSEDFGELY